MKITDFIEKHYQYKLVFTSINKFKQEFKSKFSVGAVVFRYCVKNISLGNALFQKYLKKLLNIGSLKC